MIKQYFRYRDIKIIQMTIKIVEMKHNSSNEKKVVQIMSKISKFKL